MPAGLLIEGSASRDGARLTLRYRLRGPLADLRIPEPSAEPLRLDDLWKSTCLECFLAMPTDAGYWEVNLSPAGHWNLYRLEGYRQSLQPHPIREAPQLERQVLPDGLEVTMALALPQALLNDAPLELGITAVIESRQGELSYWALAHPGRRPDFHLRQSFAVRL